MSLDKLFLKLTTFASRTAASAVNANLWKIMIQIVRVLVRFSLISSVWITQKKKNILMNS